MLSLDENRLPANARSLHKVQTLIIGRLVLIFVLLVTTWIWHSGALKLSFDAFPQGLFLVFIIAVGLTIVYFFLCRLSKAYIWQVRIQFVLDALLITWLVWRTGDLGSPYITLYIILIAVSSVFLNPIATLFMAMLSAGMFIISAILSSTGIIENFGTDQTAGKVVQYVSFNVVAILIVGILASRLSDRRHSGEKLVETTKTLASLRALHERIIESIRSGLVTTDLEGNIFTFNSAAAEITGRTAEEMEGRNISVLFSDSTRAIAAALSASFEQPARFETDLKTPDGFAVHVGYSISPLFSEELETTGLIVTFQDLTEIRSMEESVRRKDRLAAVGRVAAGLAHEIRNPLGAMRGAIQVLDSNMPPDSVQANLMEIILKESDRLNKIITNFLSYARPKVGEMAEVDLSEAIRETFTLLRHSPDIHDVHKLENDLPDKPIFILADGSQLKQVFWNLSRNAVQAMPDGGTLNVSLETMSDDRVKIVFRDTGVGMPQRQVEQLFEPFSTSTTGGTGLGLSIVYQIIRDHNGTITVTSRENEGTAISIIIPRGQNISPPEPENIDETDTGSTPISGLLNIKKT